jgi:hypothetical protein
MIKIAVRFSIFLGGDQLMVFGMRAD